MISSRKLFYFMKKTEKWTFCLGENILFLFCQVLMYFNFSLYYTISNLKNRRIIFYHHNYFYHTSVFFLLGVLPAVGQHRLPLPHHGAKGLVNRLLKLFHRCECEHEWLFVPYMPALWWTDDLPKVCPGITQCQLELAPSPSLVTLKRISGFR